VDPRREETAATSRVVATEAKVIDVAHLLPERRMMRAFFRETATFTGYWRHFADKLAGAVGIDEDGFRDRVATLDPPRLATWLADRLTDGFEPSRYQASLEADGVSRVLVSAGDDQEEGRPLLEHLAELRERSRGWIRGGLVISAADTGRIPQLFDRMTELDLRFVVCSPFRDGSRITDPHWEPMLRRCADTDTPLFVHTGQHWLPEHPYDLEHPRHIDAIARRHPSLRIIAAHAGWPWIPEMVAIAWKHPNVWVDTSAHRPKSFSQVGSGFEMLHGRMFGSFQDRVLFGSAAPIIGSTVPRLRDEVMALEIPEHAKQGWLANNVKRHFPDLLQPGPSPGES
jgi:uncharacterized protein